ncbi:hypothetical protein NCCP133_21840 [Cytobacillus sp. NCCP-133]|nr:hypothetical protein NCCP133_21840 [Cytobacillus sp. NCCP-133]
MLGNLYGKTNIPELRRRIGWVSTSLDDQFQFRSMDSVLEIVLSGKFVSIGLYEEITQHDLEKALDLMDRFHIRHAKNQILTSLSQGERRKAMIARALMASLDLFILDEPCNGLDVFSREELLHSIEDMASDRVGPTILYVTHHIEKIVPSISHALLLREGQIIAQGSKTQTLNESLLEQAFKFPIALEWDNGRAWLRVTNTIAGRI